MPRRKTTKRDNVTPNEPIILAASTPNPPKTYASVVSTSAEQPSPVGSHSGAKVYQKKGNMGKQSAPVARWVRATSCDRLHRLSLGTPIKSSSLVQSPNLGRSASVQLDTTSFSKTNQEPSLNSTDSRKAGPRRNLVRAVRAKDTAVQKSVQPKVKGNTNRAPCSIRKPKANLKEQSRELSRSASEKRFNEATFVPLTDFLNLSHSGHSNQDASLSGIAQSFTLQSIDENKPQKIGKCREVPKSKRPSRLKRAILSERVTRRCASAPGEADFNHRLKTAECQDTHSQAVVDDQISQAVSRSKLTKEQEEKVAHFLQTLSAFQDRAYVKYAHVPFHRRRTKRFVCGLREVVKHLRLKHLSLILLAQDLERRATDRCYLLKDTLTGPDAVTNMETKESPQTVPVLEDILQQIWISATHSNPVTPIIITQTRRKLARLCHKPGRVSIVGILSVAGAEDLAKELLVPGLAINLSQSVCDAHVADRVAPVEAGDSQVPGEKLDPLLTFAPVLLNSLQQAVTARTTNSLVLVEPS